jgi:hypothetical protein
MFLCNRRWYGISGLVEQETQRKHKPKTPCGEAQPQKAFSTPKFPPSGHNLWTPGDRSSVHERTERSTVKARLGREANSHAAIRLNANDPSACTALTSGHSLGSDDAFQQQRLDSMADGEIAAVARV